MRRIVVVMTAFLTILAIQAPAFAGNGNGNGSGNDTEVCHTHGGKHEKARTIRVNGNALPAFLAQGGAEGPCEQPPAEDPPAEEPPSDELPGEEPPAEEPANTPPVASATYSISTGLFSVVGVDGSSSSDADGDPLTFTWDVVNDTTGATNSYTGPEASFVYGGYDYTITLTVSDGQAEDSTTIVIQ